MDGGAFSFRGSPGFPSPMSGPTQGVTDGSDAAPGMVGEIITASLAAASAVTLSNGTAKTVISIALTPGDWDVDAKVNHLLAGVTSTKFQGSISAADNTLGPADCTAILPMITTLLSDTVSQVAPNCRVSTNANETLYLVAQMAFALGTCKAYGYITARRRR